MKNIKSQFSKDVFSQIVSNPISTEETSYFKNASGSLSLEDFITAVQGKGTHQVTETSYIIMDDSRYSLLNNGLILKVIRKNSDIATIVLEEFSWEDIYELSKQLFSKDVPFDHKLLQDVVSTLRLCGVTDLGIAPSKLKVLAPQWPLAIAGTVFARLKPMLEISQTQVKANYLAFQDMTQQQGGKSLAQYNDYHSVINTYNSLVINELNPQELLYVRNPEGICLFETDNNYPNVVPGALSEKYTSFINSLANKNNAPLALQALVEGLHYVRVNNPAQRPEYFRLDTIAKYPTDQDVYLAERARVLKSTPHFALGQAHLQILAYLGLYRPQEYYRPEQFAHAIAGMGNTREYLELKEYLKGVLEGLWEIYLIAVYAPHSFTQEHAIQVNKALVTFVQLLEQVVLNNQLNSFVSLFNSRSWTKKIRHGNFSSWGENRELMYPWIDAFIDLHQRQLPTAYRLFFMPNFFYMLQCIDSLANHVEFS